MQLDNVCKYKYLGVGFFSFFYIVKKGFAE